MNSGDALLKKIWISVVCTLLLVCRGASGDDGHDREMNSVLASVNGEAVTLMDVLPLTRGRELQARAVYSGERLAQVIGDYRKEVVNELHNPQAGQARR